MFCSKKVKVIASVAFVLSQTLSVFAADPFAEYNVTDNDIANYFFYEEGSNIELTSVPGALTEVKEVAEDEDVPYSEYRTFSNADISMSYYPVAFSTAETKEGRLGLGSQLFSFTNSASDDIDYNAEWWTFTSNDKTYLGTLAKIADEEPLVYAYVIFDVTNQDAVKLYYKKTLSASGQPIVGLVDGEPVFIVTQPGSVSPYVSEAYHFTESGIEKQSDDVFAFDWSPDTILASARRTNPNDFNAYDYMEIVGSLADEENHNYLFVFNRHPNKNLTKVENRLLVYYGQRLLGYYPAINQVPVIDDGEAVEEKTDTKAKKDSKPEVKTKAAEAKEVSEESAASSLLKFPKASEEDGNVIDFSQGIPMVVYALGSAHVFKLF